MTENFEGDVHDYLLNQMDSARRAAFERVLERDAVAQAALKAHADALAGLACEIAGAAPLSEKDQRTALATITAATRTDASAHSKATQRVIPWQRFLWPAAAALLLALNLIDFERPLATAPRPDRPRPVPANLAAGPDAARDARPDAGRRGDPTADPAAQQSGAPTRDSTRLAEERAREIERLRANVADLELAQQRLRAEYDLVTRRLAEQARIGLDLHRLSTMELVDAASYARGERKGLVAVGRGILTEPGIVVATDPPPTTPGTGTTQAAPKPPYAWSVFDEQEHRGYLNLYNLPRLAGDQSLQVWVRPADVGVYQRVAAVPQQYHGGGGSVQYALPDTSAAPAEILITIEPRNAEPAVPMGPTVLKGP